MTGFDSTLTEAAGRLAARGVACLSADRMDQAGLRPGDTIRISGRRDTHARVMVGSTTTNSLDVSAEVAANAGVGWNSDVQVCKADLPALVSVLIRTVDETADVLPDDLEEALFDLPLTEGDKLSLPTPNGRLVNCQVVSASPASAGLFGDATTLNLALRPGRLSGYDGIGGLSEQIAQVHEMIAAPLEQPALFRRLGIAPPRGVLFTGPPGSGKTLLARAIASRTSAAFYQINGPEIVSKHYGESEAALRQVFEAASRESPAIVFIDEIDAIAPRRDSLSGEKQVERRVVAQLLTLMDGLSDRGGVTVMAATNLPDDLDPALRRPGRFDREIAFTPPDPQARTEILSIHLASAPLAVDVDLDEIAAQAHGYLGADLAALAREAGLAALGRAMTSKDAASEIDLSTLFIMQDDLLSGLAATAPSALRDTTVESPAVTWQDIGGLEDEKSILTEAVVWPRRHQEAFSAFRITPPRGILLSGPPGTGKTLLARALAHESGMNFIPVRPTRLLSQYLGEAERAVASIFARARQASPCIVFFDELDALAPSRRGADAVLDRIVAQLLMEMDGIQPIRGVVVVAATNRPDAIDPALTRPGRFDIILPIPLPDTATRAAILDVHLSGRPVAGDVESEDLAEAFEGLSGAALATVVNAAAREALRRVVTGDEADAVIRRADLMTAARRQSANDASRQKDYLGQGATT